MSSLEYLWESAQAATIEFGDSGEVSALDQVVNDLKALVSHENWSDADVEFRFVVLTDGGSTFLRRYQFTAEPDDLRASTKWSKQAVEIAANQNLDRAAPLNNLAIAYSELYEITGNAKLIDDAIAAGTQCVDATPKEADQRPTRLGSLATSYHIRFERFGQIENLARAIELWEQAIAGVAGESHDAADLYSNLAGALCDRHECNGDLGDLETALEIWQTAARMSDPQSFEFPALLGSVYKVMELGFGGIAG